MMMVIKAHKFEIFHKCSSGCRKINQNMSGTHSVIIQYLVKTKLSDQYSTFLLKRILIGLILDRYSMKRTYYCILHVLEFVPCK